MAYLLRDKTDIKIFVLYLLDNIDVPLDFVTLHDIVVQDEFVGQFDFMECFFELCETEAIKKTESDAKAHYSLTEEGKNAAEALLALGYTNIWEFGGIIDWNYGIETE